MNERKVRRETERVVRRVLKFVESQDTIGKKEFETILDKIIEHVHKNTGVDMHVVGQKTNKVVRDLPGEYGRLNEDMRSWEAMISYLYLKYLHELGIL
jgi:hypothetical protein